MKKIFFISLVTIIVLAGCSKHTPSPNSNSGGSSIPAVTSTSTVSINADSSFQTVEGFGGANIVAWTGDLTQNERIEAFSPTSGIGLSILRVRVPNKSSQFASEIPTISAAKSYGVKVIATAWNAPDSMENNDTLKTSSFASYAAYLKSYTVAVGGVYAIGPWNEPNYASSTWMHASSKEIANFVAAYGSDCGAPIMAPSPFNMDPSFIHAFLNDSAAKANTLFVCGHIYGATPYNLGNIGKQVWMTEHYTNSNVSGNDWANAMVAAKEINDCMSVNWSAYVEWYIRRSYSLIDENGNITKLGYVMAQYARYVRPGYLRIACTANPYTGIYVTAYKSGDGSKLVVVAINQNTFEVNQTFSWSGIPVNGFSRFRTTVTTNLESDSLSASGSSVEITLPESSVTTLVSQ